jgi:hypothetical protein
MRSWLPILPLLAGLALAWLTCVALAACGDDPGYSGLPWAYSIDATPDGVLPSDDDAGVNRH